MNISVGISAGELSKAAAMVRQYAESIEPKLNKAIAKVENVGYEAAVISIRNESGELEASVTDNDGRRGISVRNDHAAFHEFGTGVVGQNSYTYPLPVPWEYDQKRHPQAHAANGYWFYEDPHTGEKRWTKGQRGAAYMAKAAEAMRQEVRPAIQEAFA